MIGFEGEYRDGKKLSLRFTGSKREIQNLGKWILRAADKDGDVWDDSPSR